MIDSVFRTISRQRTLELYCQHEMLLNEAISFIFQPFSIVGNFVRWLMTEIVLLVINFNQYSYAEEDPGK